MWGSSAEALQPTLTKRCHTRGSEGGTCSSLYCLCLVQHLTGRRRTLKSKFSSWSAWRCLAWLWPTRVSTCAVPLLLSLCLGHRRLRCSSNTPYTLLRQGLPICSALLFRTVFVPVTTWLALHWAVSCFQVISSEKTTLTETAPFPASSPACDPCLHSTHQR